MTDPALRQAIAEAEVRPSSGRIKLRPFAEQDNAAAIASICIAYGRSIDTEVRGAERKQAFAWCQHAAAEGNIEAQYYLGRFYHWGIGTPENRTLALQWYTTAASRGHIEAEDAQRGLEGKPSICRNWITGCRMF